MKLQIHDLCKQFDGHLVLDHVSMELVSGHIYCLMAPSGTGKTTLFRILMGLEHADSGEIIVQRKTKEAGQAADEKVADWQENETLQNLCIGAVFQEDRLCEAFSAVENVLMTEASSMSRAEAERELRELLPQEALNRPVATLSGGQKRRVALCRALCAPSDLLILDEPFTGLDAGTRMEGIRYLQKKSAGKLTLLSTHQEDDIPTLNGIRITI